MVYSTDRSKAVFPVLVLLRVALWFILLGEKRRNIYSSNNILLFSFAWCYCVGVFFSPLGIGITSLEEEKAYLSAFRTFVRFVLVRFCLFPLPLSVWEGLRLVIVALPGLISYFFLKK